LTFDLKFAGGRPGAGGFLLRRQKKVTKENATLPRRPHGISSVPHQTWRLRNSRVPRSDSARRLLPSLAAVFGGSEGENSQAKTASVCKLVLV